jgi:hypothetical protein
VYDIDRRAQQMILARESEYLEGVRAQAATYVRSRAVDEAEAQVFLDMLGLAS